MDTKLREAYSVDKFRASGHRIIDLLADHLQQGLSGNQHGALPWRSPESAMQEWTDFAQTSPDIGTFFQRVLAGSVCISDPRYMGHQVCLPAPDAMLAGLLVDYLNNGSGVYEMGMAGTAMEQFVIRQTAKLFAWNDAADGFLTSGGTLANLTALLAARSAKSSNNDWKNGTCKSLSVLVSDQAHYSVDRAARIMGWGEAGITRVPTGANFRMRVDLLPEIFRNSRSEGREIIAVVGCAGTTSTGSFDDLPGIAEFCAANNLWFHVDGAHGAAVAFSRRHRSLVDGIAMADSVTIDFHKMLMTPVLCSALLFRNGQDSFRTFQLEADYLFGEKQSPQADCAARYDLAKRTFECTKAMMSAKIYSLMAIHGLPLLEAQVDHLHNLANVFAKLIANRPGFQLAMQPQSNIVCFRYVANATNGWLMNSQGCHEDAISALTLKVRQALTQEGKHYIVQTKLRGQVWLRCVLTNPFTTSAEMESLLDAIQQLANKAMLADKQ